MAQRTVCVTIKQVLAMTGVANGLGGSLHFLLANIGDDLPDFFVGHPDALAVGSVGWHRGAGNAIADDLEHLCVGVRVFLVSSRKIWPTSSAVRAQPMTQRAIDSKLVLSRLRCLDASGQRIAILGRMSCNPE